MRKGEDGGPALVGMSGAESGKESVKGSGRRMGSRQNSKEKDKKGTPASSIRNLKRPEGSTLRQKSSTQSSLLWRRSLGKELPLPQIALNMPPQSSPPMVRSTSAPSSPMPPCEPVSPGMTTIVGSTDEPRLSESLVLSKPDAAVSSSRPILATKRQLTAPTFPKFLKRSDQDVHTDTEASGTMAPRAKHREKERMRGSVPDVSRRPSEEGATLEMRPKTTRRQTARLMKISLPDPITQHFAEGWGHGWPHAGTWQDAYYGYYSEHPNTPDEDGPHGRRSSQEAVKTSSRRSSVEKRSGGRRKSKGQDRYETPEQTDRSMPDSPALDPVIEDSPKKKSRRSKGRRYRHAIAPPTPSGLGFTPNGGGKRDGEGWKEGQIDRSEGFDWGNTTAHGRGRTIEEADELSRSATRVTSNEKSASSGSGTRWWWVFSGQQGVQGGRDDVGLGKKLRRMLFLDARVTIYIRLFNLAVVIASLGKSSSINSESQLTNRSSGKDPSPTRRASRPWPHGIIHHPLNFVFSIHRPSHPHGNLSRILW